LNRYTLQAFAALFLILAIGPARADAQAVAVQAKVDIRAPGGKRNSDGSNVVMWLSPLSSRPSLSEANKHYVITQQNKSFTPHVLAVPVGTRVEFPNKDPFFHNVFSLYQGKRFDLGLYEAGSSREVLFDKPGVSFIFCNIHPSMSAYVLALDTPYFAVSDKHGNLTISGVPPGEYQLQVWYERAESDDLASLSRRLTVDSADVRIGTLVVEESAKFTPSHTNKHGQQYDPELSPY
jgi:plastocyanin